jgi:predicted enzyme related to lactoylglutathione lyase
MAAVTYFEISGPDVDKLREFYVTTLELPTDGPPDPAYVQFAPGDGAIPGGLLDAGPLFESPGLTYAMPYVQVDDVEAAVDRAVAAGATVVASIRQHGPTRSAHLLDPAGNRFGLYTMVAPG